MRWQRKKVLNRQYLVGTGDLDLRGDLVPNALAVGWLDTEHEFVRGDAPDEALQRLIVLSFRLVNQTRGLFRSPFLPNTAPHPTIEYKGKSMRLGSAEIWVKDTDGTIYVSPNLICHYIRDNKYLSPREYLDALMRLDIFGTA